MKSSTTQEVINASSLDQSVKVLENRRAELLAAIGDRKIEPTPEIMLELAEINVALGDVEVPGESRDFNG